MPDEMISVPRGMIEQFCNDLNQAHNELLKAQGCSDAGLSSFDWPDWSPQANSIRWAERLLGEPLSKTNKSKLRVQERT